MGVVSDKEANLERFFFFNLPGCLSKSLIKSYFSQRTPKVVQCHRNLSKLLYRDCSSP